MFLSSRGCVICLRRGSTRGAYAIEGLSTGGCPPVLITGVSPSDRDIVQPVTTLTNKKIIYVFGEAIGDVQISGLAFLGKGADADTMQRVVSFMKSRRLSAGNKTPVNVAIPGGAMKVHITGMALGNADPEYNVQGFMLSGLIVEPP
jgi:hypothetical protein